MGMRPGLVCCMISSDTTTHPVLNFSMFLGMGVEMNWHISGQ